MSKTMFILLDQEVTDAGSYIPAGEVVEVSEKSGRALIAEGVGRESDAEGVTDDAQDVSEDVEDEDSQNEQDAVQRDRMALNDQYTVPELKDAAKAAGVDFPYDIKKDALINAIIEQGATAEILK